MSNEIIIDIENQNPLLPFGEILRPLIRGSNLSDTDLRFVLQKRGIFVKDYSKKSTIPKIVSILLSPREFNILKNRQSFREDTIKTSDAKTNWNSDKTILQAIPDEIEKFAENLIDENSSYQLTDCSIQNVTPDEVRINCSIKRQDWTKDVFSRTTHHDCSLSIRKETNSNIVTYHTETTAPETKDLIDKLQNKFHSHFRQQGDIAPNTPIQRIMADHFLDNIFIFEFLNTFTQQIDTLSFLKIVDIDAGIDHECPNFPEHFQWLKNKIDQISLRGNNIHETDIMMLSKKGGFVFGEIEVQFNFEYSEAKGKCVIRYGFPGFYEKRKPVEFEAKIASLELHADYADVSKNRVEKFLLQEFQKRKHTVFEQFKVDKKVNAQKRNSKNQYVFEGEGWDDL